MAQVGLVAQVFLVVRTVQAVQAARDFMVAQTVWADHSAILIM